MLAATYIQVRWVGLTPRIVFSSCCGAGSLMPGLASQGNFIISWKFLLFDGDPALARWVGLTPRLFIN